MDDRTVPIEHETQALVTGCLASTLMTSDFLNVEIVVDEEGNYQGTFFVVGRETGVKLRVSVEVVHDG